MTLKPAVGGINKNEPDGALDAPTAVTQYADISVRPAQLCDATVIAELAAAEFNESAPSVETISRVIAFGAEGLFSILKSRESCEPAVVGFFGVLLLNSSGVEAIKSRRFNAKDPSLSMLCRAGEVPAALYGWGIVAKGIGKIVMPMVERHFTEPRFNNINVYARGGSPKGIAHVLKMGGVPVFRGDDLRSGCLAVYPLRPPSRSL